MTQIPNTPHTTQSGSWKIAPSGHTNELTVDNYWEKIADSQNWEYGNNKRSFDIYRDGSHENKFHKCNTLLE